MRAIPCWVEVSGRRGARGGVIPAWDLASIRESLPGLVARGVVGVMLQGNAVDTIAQAGGIGPVGKDMSKMSFAIGAAHLCPAHEKGAVFMLAHGAAFGRSIETRPASAGIVFRFR